MAPVGRVWIEQIVPSGWRAHARLQVQVEKSGGAAQVMLSTLIVRVVSTKQA